MESLEGKVALVTGSSRGIGRAIAVSLACRGADVAVNYRERGDDAAEVVRQIEATGRRGIAVRADVGDPDDALELFATTVESLGRLDILVNNAGVWRGSRIEDVEVSLLERVIATNLKSAFYLAGPAAELMKEEGWGRIINVSSVIGVTGYPGNSVYGATKAALIGMVKSLARELARHNITVNAVIPGFIETDMAHEVDDDTRARVVAKIPMRRYGKPEDVGELVAFLCEHGDYMTGQLFTVDGGYTI
jgi:NAD(P)-dependent dehydrogenase (short-subunit alcohol dehydrogenase family)